VESVGNVIKISFKKRRYHKDRQAETTFQGTDNISLMLVRVEGTDLERRCNECINIQP